jgi:hypothetical protein
VTKYGKKQNASHFKFGTHFKFYPPKEALHAKETIIAVDE